MDHPTISLDTVQIASPCQASWDDMAGTDCERFCQLCQQSVYNLSAMTRDQAEALLREKAGRACLRLYRRRDGTVLTRDCPVGLRALRRRVALRVSAVAASLLALVAWGGAVIGVTFGRASSRDESVSKVNNLDPDPHGCEPTMGMPALPPRPGVNPDNLAGGPARDVPPAAAQTQGGE